MTLDPRSTLLFMDDEIETADVVRYAIEALQASGFDVCAVPRISDAIDGFYGRYVHVFVLDVDMSFVDDHQAGTGSEVGRFLRSLVSSAHMMVVIARGGFGVWVAGANHHLFGYVVNGVPGAIDQLVELAREARDATLGVIPARSTAAETPRRSLLAVHGECVVTPEELLLAAGGALPGWEHDLVGSLGEAARRLADEPEAYGVVGVIAAEFSARPAELAQIRELCAASPRPHAVFGCLGRPESRPSILALVCARPFRLVDIDSQSPATAFAEALAVAAGHYGGRELLVPDPRGLRRLRLEFSADVMTSMGHHTDGGEADDGDRERELE